jgi:[FeFe] hydrogenase H-cluster maturation GTPase HydF
VSGLNQTPSGERVHVTVLGRRNAGKSSLVNALCGQPVAIVSDVAGTTTDPVSKAMEILPLGPVVVTDTAGLDDQGELGALRVKASLRALDRTDVAVLVVPAGTVPGEPEDTLLAQAKALGLPVVVVVNKVDMCPVGEPLRGWAARGGVSLVEASATAGHGLEEVKRALVAAVPGGLDDPPIVGDLLSQGDLVVLVVPIDKAAPKGRLILPQVMTLRDILDHEAVGVVVKERELRACLDRLGRRPKIVITDSQVFMKVAADVPRDVMLTGFSILMARHRGDLASFVEGTRALKDLRPGDRVLVSEGCTHHRQADDIGSVQIPRWLRQMVGGDLQFSFSHGLGFPGDLGSYKLAIHCGACTLNRREVLHRQREARAAGVPMTNYGMVLAHVHGILERALEPFPLARMAWSQDVTECHVPRLQLARTTL